MGKIILLVVCVFLVSLACFMVVAEEGDEDTGGEIGSSGDQSGGGWGIDSDDTDTTDSSIDTEGNGDGNENIYDSPDFVDMPSGKIGWELNKDKITVGEGNWLTSEKLEISPLGTTTISKIKDGWKIDGNARFSHGPFSGKVEDSKISIDKFNKDKIGTGASVLVETKTPEGHISFYSDPEWGSSIMETEKQKIEKSIAITWDKEKAQETLKDYEAEKETVMNINPSKKEIDDVKKNFNVGDLEDEKVEAVISMAETRSKMGVKGTVTTDVIITSDEQGRKVTGHMDGDWDSWLAGPTKSEKALEAMADQIRNDKKAGLSDEEKDDLIGAIKSIPVEEKFDITFSAEEEEDSTHVSFYDEDGNSIPNSQVTLEGKASGLLNAMTGLTY